MVRKQPTLIWVDDVHWIDPSSAELLQELVKRLANAAVLVALTGRSFPKSPNLPSTENAIELGQLSLDECYELARAIPRAQDLSDEELKRAVEAADGNSAFRGISCPVPRRSEGAGTQCRAPTRRTCR
jgi:predicted ATPase